MTWGPAGKRVQSAERVWSARRAPSGKRVQSVGRGQSAESVAVRREGPSQRAASSREHSGQDAVQQPARPPASRWLRRAERRVAPARQALTTYPPQVLVRVQVQVLELVQVLEPPSGPIQLPPALAPVLYDLPERRHCNVRLNFPLYSGVESVEIGVEAKSEVTASPAYTHNSRIIFYGTSITQGGCANRPGMAYTNILSRRFPYEIINLGFSGNGKGEPEVATIISKIPDPACLVLDYEANVTDPADMRRTLPAFIDIFRHEHPHVPILVLSKIRYSKERFDQRFLNIRLEMKQIQEETVEARRRQGDSLIYFGDGSEFLGADDYEECTVDGVHPTDLGFLRMADAITPLLHQILNVVP